MRLLFLSNLYPPHDLGGYEQLCQEAADALRARGHAVHVLTSRFGTVGQPEQDGNVTRSLYLQADVDHYRPADVLFRRARERANARELGLAIERFSPDLVVVWGMWNLSREVPYWAEQWLPGRVAYYVSSYWPSDPDVHEQYWRAPANHPVVSALLRPFGERVIRQVRAERAAHPLRLEEARCCSGYVRDTLVRSGSLPDAAQVLYCGIDPAPFARGTPEQHNGPLRLLYFGSLLPHKGVHTAVEALGLLRERGLDDRVHLTLLGGGHPDYVARLHRLVGDLDLGDRVEFAGRVPRAEVPGRLAEHDVFLFTSIWAEPLARTVMEAMAAGLLVIGSEVGGQTEMLADGENALTFQPEDATTLAEQIARVLAEPALGRRLAEAGRQMALERFTTRRMVDGLEAWLAEMAA